MSTTPAEPVKVGFFSAPTPRPLSISIVGWWLVFNGVTTFLAILSVTNPQVQEMLSEMGQSRGLMVGNSIVSGLAYAGIGWGVLKGHSWARPGYFGFGAASLVFAAIVAPGGYSMLVFGVLSYVILGLLLSTPVARAFFDGSFASETDQQERQRVLSQIRNAQKNPSDVKQVLGVGLTVIAGFLLMIAAVFTGLPESGTASKGLVTIGLPAAALLLVASWLWGRARWRALIGWCLSAVGFTHLLGAFSLIAMQHSPMWETMTAQSASYEAVPQSFFMLTGLTGLVLAVIGMGMLYTQYKLDGDIASRVLAKQRNSLSQEGE